MDKIMLDDPEEFAALLQGHLVKHIFFGHGHRAVSGVWRGISFSALPSLNHQLPLVGGSVETIYSDEPPAYAVVHVTGEGIIVHNDAFLLLQGGLREAFAIPGGATIRCMFGHEG